MNNWIEASDQLNTLICLFKKEISLKIEIPSPKTIEVTYKGKTNSYIADRYELSLDKPPGGQCEGRLYKLTGIFVGRGEETNGGFYALKEWNESTQSYDIEICNNFDDEISFPVLTGKILSIRVFLESGMQKVEVVHNNGNSVITDFPWISPRQTGFCLESGTLIRPYGYIFESDFFEVTGVKPYDQNISLQEDINECGGEALYTLKLYDCNDNLTETLSYDEKPKIVTKDKGYMPPIYISKNLYYVNHIEVLKNVNDNNKLCSEIYLVVPLDVLKISEKKPPKPNEEFYRYLVGSYCSPDCATISPKVSYICECTERCPSQTVCSIQQGNKICCLDKDGNVIKQIDPGCFKPDIKC